MRPIDADKLKVDMLERGFYPVFLKVGIESAPTLTYADLVPHGRWIMHDDKVFGLSCECSVCHIETCGDTPYCPHCGAKMCVK